MSWLWLSYFWKPQTSILLKTQFNSFSVCFPRSRVLPSEAEREQPVELEDPSQLHGPDRPLRHLRGEHPPDHRSLLLQDLRRETQPSVGCRHPLSSAGALHSSWIDQDRKWAERFDRHRPERQRNQYARFRCWPERKRTGIHRFHGRTIFAGSDPRRKQTGRNRFGSQLWFTRLSGSRVFRIFRSPISGTETVDRI